MLRHTAFLENPLLTLVNSIRGEADAKRTRQHCYSTTEQGCCHLEVWEGDADHETRAAVARTESHLRVVSLDDGLHNSQS